MDPVTISLNVNEPVEVRSGSEISIFDLKVQNPAKPNYKFKRVAPVLIEIL